jgi:hypothetical protein
VRRRHLGASAAGRALRWWSISTLAVVCAFAAAPRAGAATPSALPSSTETTAGSLAVVPMGDLNDEVNTFWQVLRATPGSSHWSVVTPRGVADNGGIVLGASGDAIVAGVLPSQLLRFSPLASSTDGGATWDPALFPGALAPRPDALAVGPAGSGDLAVMGSWVLRATPSLSTWSRLVSLATLARRDPGCGAEELDAVASGPAGEPLVGMGCRGSGAVALFTSTGGTWEAIGAHLGGVWRGAATSVLRLESSQAGTTVLVSASSGNRRALAALWRSALGQWSMSPILRLMPGASVRASAISAGGSFAVLVGRGRLRSVETVSPGQPWVPLPAPPADVVSIAAVTPTLTPPTAIAYDALSVEGAQLRVFTLTPAGTRWVRAQSTLVPLAYGSSS